MPVLDRDRQRQLRAYDAARIRKWRERHTRAEVRANSKGKSKIRLGLVRQAIRSTEGGTLPMQLPEELVGLVVPQPTPQEITMGRERNLEKARRRVEKRRAYVQRLRADGLPDDD